MQFAVLPLHLLHLETEVHADGGQVVLGEVVVAEPDEEGGLADSLIAHDDYFEKIILVTNHNIE